MDNRAQQLINTTTKFLDLCETHPAQAGMFYQENKDVIDSIIQFHKDNKDRIKNLSTQIFLSELEQFLIAKYAKG